jgi:hypothetical protein
MKMIDKKQIEQEIREQVNGQSATGVYVVYLTTDADTSLVTFKGDLNQAIQNFLSQIDDNGSSLVDTKYSNVNISSIEEFAQNSSHIQ